MSVLLRIVLLLAGGLAAYLVQPQAAVFPVAQGMVALLLVALVALGVALLRER